MCTLSLENKIFNKCLNLNGTQENKKSLTFKAVNFIMKIKYQIKAEFIESHKFLNILKNIVVFRENSN